MKTAFFLLLVLLAGQLPIEARFLNTAGLAGAKRMVLQAGYASSARTGPEFKIVYGLSDPWDMIGYYSEGSYSNVAGRTFQTVGWQLEYGLGRESYSEGRLIDVSCLLGAEVTKDLLTNSVTAEETAVQVGLLLGKDLTAKNGVWTPYGGIKINIISAATPANDWELAGGLKYTFNSAYSAMLELSYHNLDRNGSKSNNLEWSLAGSWNI